jgi:integrase
LILAAPAGGRLNPNSVLRNLAAIQRKVDAAPDVPVGVRLPRCTINDLRHTHATHLLMDERSVAVVSRRLDDATLAAFASVGTESWRQPVSGRAQVWGW